MTEHLERRPAGIALQPARLAPHRLGHRGPPLRIERDHPFRLLHVHLRPAGARGARAGLRTAAMPQRRRQRAEPTRRPSSERLLAWGCMSTSEAAAGPVVITHFSDLLCVWAYVAQIRLDELHRRLGDGVAVRSRFCSVFGDVGFKMERGWRDRGGLAGYRRHVESVVAGFDHVTLHPDTWQRAAPRTSATAHAFVKAAELAAPRDGDGSGPSPADRLAWRLRLAFFRDGLDPTSRAVQVALAVELGLPVDAILAHLDDGTAWAALLRDYEDAATERVRGSPTWILNEHRQILYGNVGYRVIEANVQELLRSPAGEASWC